MRNEESVWFLKADLGGRDGRASAYMARSWAFRRKPSETLPCLNPTESHRAGHLPSHRESLDRNSKGNPTCLAAAPPRTGAKPPGFMILETASTSGGWSSSRRTVPYFIQSIRSPSALVAVGATDGHGVTVGRLGRCAAQHGRTTGAYSYIRSLALRIATVRQREKATKKSL